MVIHLLSRSLVLLNNLSVFVSETIDRTTPCSFMRSLFSQEPLGCICGPFLQMLQWIEHHPRADHGESETNANKLFSL
jgi:hypothetical protein